MVFVLLSFFLEFNLRPNIILYPRNHSITIILHFMFLESPYRCQPPSQGCKLPQSNLLPHLFPPNPPSSDFKNVVFPTSPPRYGIWCLLQDRCMEEKAYCQFSTRKQVMGINPANNTKCFHGTG